MAGLKQEFGATDISTIAGDSLRNIAPRGPALDPGHVRKLRALSVTTVEELIGLAAADPDALGQFLEIHDVAQLQADVARVASTALLSTASRFEDAQYSLGALPPKGASVEERASASTFQDYFAQGLASPPGGVGGGSGVQANLMGCFGAVRNQERRGTCVAHAVCAVAECRESQMDGVDPDLSEQYLYFLCKQADGHPERAGTFVEMAMNAMKKDGICREETWPYQPLPIPQNEGQGPAPQGAPEEAAQHRIPSVAALDPRSAKQIREALDRETPVALSIPLYVNFTKNAVANATGLIPMPLPNSALDGGHAMCAMGY